MDERLIEDKSLLPVVEKVESGERLTLKDGLLLLKTKDILTLGYLANAVREKLNGKFTYFVVNRHINLTNICVGTCKFCAFRRKKGEPEAYELTVDEVLKKVEDGIKFGITEVHIVSGLHPDWKFENYLEFVREIKKTFPQLKIQAFTAEEVKHFSEISGSSFYEVIEKLIESGVDSLAGGAGEIFSFRVRKLLCPEKVSAEEYLEIHRIAHKLGLKTNASILYGHIETAEERIKHLLSLRTLQDETGGFQAMLCFAYHPKNTELGGNFTTGFDDLKMISVSRLMLDNFPHIKVFRIMVGEKLAQVSLNFGADDIDGTVIEEEITTRAGSNETPFITREKIVHLIKETGKIPVERDTFYNVLNVYDGVEVASQR